MISGPWLIATAFLAVCYLIAGGGLSWLFLSESNSTRGGLPGVRLALEATLVTLFWPFFVVSLVLEAATRR